MYNSPAWSKEENNWQHALGKLIEGMGEAAARGHNPWFDVYWLFVDFRNRAFEKHLT